jgi:hypothetical protein
MEVGCQMPGFHVYHIHLPRCRTETYQIVVRLLYLVCGFSVVETKVNNHVCKSYYNFKATYNRSILLNSSS